jgi:hypothetical protein
MNERLISPIPLYTFCRICECRLHTPEEWHDGRCALHASDKPAPVVSDPDWDMILEWIDSYIEQPYEPPTGVIPRPNRIA